MALSNNDRARVIKDSSTKYIHSEAPILKEYGLIKDSDEIDSYILTSKGIWYLEAKYEDFTERFLNYIDARFFETTKRESISPRLKTALFSMATMRIFSINCTVDMRESANVKDEWWSILKKASEQLSKSGIVKEEEDLKNYKSKRESEHPALNIFRHSDKLPRATKGIFSKTGDLQYYLDVIDTTNLDFPDPEKLAYILYQIFSEKLDSFLAEIMYEFMCSFCRREGIKIQESLKVSYFQPEYDNIIQMAFDIALENKDAWG